MGSFAVLSVGLTGGSMKAHAWLIALKQRDIVMDAVLVLMLTSLKLTQNKVRLM